MHTQPNNASGLLLEVDFKWLMAGQGCAVDPDRLLWDADYTDRCIQFALHSHCGALLDCAKQLQAALDCRH